MAPIYSLPGPHVAESAHQEAEKLPDLLDQVSKTSTGEINSLIGDFEELRTKLATDSDSIRREVEEYKALSKQVLDMTKIISENLEKLPTVRASLNQYRRLADK
jgi:hypothetical protein